jgi:hypothetical protein
VPRATSPAADAGAGLGGVQWNIDVSWARAAEAHEWLCSCARYWMSRTT